MKYTLIAMLAASSFAGATTIVFSGSPANSNRIVDNMGRAIAAADGASVTAGSVSGDAFSSLVGTNGSSTGAIGNPAVVLLDGLWNGQTSNNSAEADAFNASPIAVQIVVSPDVFAVVTTSAVFPANGGGVGDSLTVPIDSITGVVTSLSTPGTVFENNQLVLGAAIPEPSSALLAGLALVGGLVRRRR